ncbi:hypothetical protein [Streptomyces sp. NPDC086787]|uniref:hypothetical protein n=1 Tax=Streptomyces sp. NPDC086787 TaxID=3365759 RepID=UPI0037FC69D2
MTSGPTGAPVSPVPSPVSTALSRRRLLFAAAGAAGLAALPTTAWADPAGLLHDIGSIGGPGTPSEATDINDRGDVVGVTSLPGTSVSHAFVMNPRVRGGRPIDITPSESRSSRAEAVNGSGVVVGTLGMGIATAMAGLRATPHTLAPGIAASALGRASSAGGGPLLQPFVWRPHGGLDALPLPPGAEGARAVDINDRGTVLVVGTNATGTGLPVGSYLWDPDCRTYTRIPPTDSSPTGPVALAHKLDARGGVMGGLVTEVGPQAWQHTSAVWEPGTLTTHRLPAGGASDTYATDRNEKGLIVGWRMDTSGGLTTAVYWPHPDAAPVALPGRVAFKVNNTGQIVGIRDFPDSSVFPFTAVMWEPARGRTTALGDKNLGSYVLAINTTGQSAGYALTPGETTPHNTATWWDTPRRSGGRGHS